MEVGYKESFRGSKKNQGVEGRGSSTGVEADIPENKICRGLAQYRKISGNSAGREVKGGGKNNYKTQQKSVGLIYDSINRKKLKKTKTKRKRRGPSKIAGTPVSSFFLWVSSHQLFPETSQEWERSEYARSLSLERKTEGIPQHHWGASKHFG